MKRLRRAGGNEPKHAGGCEHLALRLIETPRPGKIGPLRLKDGCGRENNYGDDGAHHWAPRFNATIFSRSRAYSVRPASVGTVHVVVSNTFLASARMVTPSGASFASARSPSSSMMMALLSA